MASTAEPPACAPEPGTPTEGPDSHDPAAGRSARPGPDRASTLELFFDLVFVFTISQVAFIVEHRPGWPAVAQALLELVVIFWMYGGFTWLTNTLGATRIRQRIVVLLGMAAFLVVSLAVPRAFTTDGVAFGWAYLALNMVHLAGFLIGDVPDAARAMRRIGSTNLAAAALVLVAGYAGAPWHWPLWLVAVAVQWGPSLAGPRTRAFQINAAHFSERHGAMIIIVLGESLVSVALAAQDLPVTWRLGYGVLSGLAASAAMWWAYFAGEDDAASRAFARLPAARNGLIALVGYDIPHVLMLAGVVGVAAGSRLSLPHLTAPAGLGAACLIGGGIALYVLSLATFRGVLHTGTVWLRVLGGLALLAFIPIGTSAGAATQLLASGALLAAVLAIEHRVTHADARPRSDLGGDPASTDRAGWHA